ncbi:MAG: hypothetical protein KDA81_21840, partial [Planctomycetaceae bacterium]|nr:hypothetical protein [Planctomycetaceae bacterium]
MSNRIAVCCDACQKKLAVPDSAAGRRIRCPQCGGPVPVPQQNRPAAPTTPATSAPATSARGATSKNKASRPERRSDAAASRTTAESQKRQRQQPMSAPARPQRSRSVAVRPPEDDPFAAPFGDSLNDYSSEMPPRRKKKSGGTSSRPKLVGSGNEPPPPVRGPGLPFQDRLFSSSVMGGLGM